MDTIIPKPPFIEFLATISLTIFLGFITYTTNVFLTLINKNDAPFLQRVANFNTIGLLILYFINMIAFLFLPFFSKIKPLSLIIVIISFTSLCLSIESFKVEFLSSKFIITFIKIFFVPVLSMIIHSSFTISLFKSKYSYLLLVVCILSQIVTKLFPNFFRKLPFLYAEPLVYITLYIISLYIDNYFSKVSTNAAASYKIVFIEKYNLYCLISLFISIGFNNILKLSLSPSIALIASITVSIFASFRYGLNNSMLFIINPAGAALVLLLLMGLTSHFNSMLYLGLRTCNSIFIAGYTIFLMLK
ncbi:hypothetical protein DICPUDRAFT_80702 [Dictyostelium purpureum]|uniref:Uncharacterized protein n=1 Tax=Dictyostelium purpureum TaxID=5786 RepID=F0ZR97_DICPU|nr:uncharacterized protein DICPUDRAFT_80702 [Dictyostelium purpureum]EGC33521.1 hypothetical protein DICPUDRAFT_80702 [Dictyostelium purpureum]|eukprot:XP_003289946.1 hypothetical protein DICPUDRAFT_80702 [Dictyostelium purpureum]